MSKKLPMLLMKRTQHTEIGHLRAGIAYRFEPDVPRHVKVHKRVLDRGFGKNVTQKDLNAMKAEAEALSSAKVAQSDGDAEAQDQIAAEGGDG